MMNKKIAIIPARGGSKRIPRKNIKPFLGKPIIAYSIEAAIKSKLFDIVMVSTDDEEIAEVARNFGAEVPFLRSKKNADDFATTYDVIEEVLEAYNKRGISFSEAICIYATAPFVNKERINEAYSLFVEKEFDCVFPVIEYSFPIQRSLIVHEESSKMELLFPENELKRSQDLKPSYHDVGQFYLFRVERLLKKKKLWTDNTGVIIINAMEGQDIDNEVDWEMAELKYKMLNEEKNII